MDQIFVSYRLWRTSKSTLRCSVHRDTYYPPSTNKLRSIFIDYDWDKDDNKQRSSNFGIFGVSQPHLLPMAFLSTYGYTKQDTSGLIAGAIVQWGKIKECENGMESSRARIEHLLALDNGSYDEIAEYYGVGLSYDREIAALMDLTFKITKSEHSDNDYWPGAWDIVKRNSIYRSLSRKYERHTDGIRLHTSL